MGEAHTWAKDERVTYPICVDCTLQRWLDPDERTHHACDGCGLIIDALAALTGFRVEPGHLEGPLQLCARCSPGGPSRTGRVTSRSISWPSDAWPSLAHIGHTKTANCVGSQCTHHEHR